MSFTGEDIFNQSLALIGMIQEDGTISTDDTAIYRAKAPQLLTLGQFDLAKSGDLYNTVEYINTDNSTIGQWVKYTLPTDFKSIDDIVFEYDNGKQIENITYRRFGKNGIYVYFTQTGTVRISYIPVPTKITALTQTLQIDDYSAMKLAWFLAWQFKLAEQDETAVIFENEYKSLKRESSKPAIFTEIIDVYA